MKEHVFSNINTLKIEAGLQTINGIAYDPDRMEIVIRDKQPKPLLADAQVGDLCKRRDGKWVQIDNINRNHTFDGRQYPYAYQFEGDTYCVGIDGKWYYGECSNNGSNLDIIHTEPLASEGTKDWAIQMMKLGDKVYNAVLGIGDIFHWDSDHQSPQCKNQIYLEDQFYTDFRLSGIPTGWQLYTEPEQPNTTPKPLLADAQVGDLLIVDYGNLNSWLNTEQSNIITSVDESVITCNNGFKFSMITGKLISYPGRDRDYSGLIAIRIENPKPLLADAQVGWLCKRRDGKFVQIEEIDHNYHVDGTYYPYGYTLEPCEYSVTLDGSWLKGRASNNDIIHTEPLAPEGTAEWMIQMLKLGKQVIGYEEQPFKLDPDGKISCGGSIFAANLATLLYQMKSDMPTGWQLYTEPVEPPYKVGDWVKYKVLMGNDATYVGKIISTSKIGGNAIEVLPTGTYDRNSSLSVYHVTYPSLITRKLSPDQVIISIGCLSGTVKKAYSDAHFIMYHGDNCDDNSCILFSALDTPTREFVQGLLNTQGEA